MAKKNIIVAVINGKRALIAGNSYSKTITGLVRRWVHPSITSANIDSNGTITVKVWDATFRPNTEGWEKVILEASKYKRRLFTYIKDGYIISSVAYKGYYREMRMGTWSTVPCLCNEGVFRKEKITSPRKKWDGEPFTNYSATCGENPYIEGVLSYGEYCNAVNKNNKFLFNDFTKCSEAMWDVLTRH